MLYLIATRQRAGNVTPSASTTVCKNLDRSTDLYRWFAPNGTVRAAYLLSDKRKSVVPTQVLSWGATCPRQWGVTCPRQWGATCPRSDLAGAAETVFTSPVASTEKLLWCKCGCLCTYVQIINNTHQSCLNLLCICLVITRYAIHIWYL